MAGDAFSINARLDASSYAKGATMTLTASGTVTSGATQLSWGIASVSDNLGHKWTLSPDGKSATAKA